MIVPRVGVTIQVSSLHDSSLPSAVRKDFLVGTGVVACGDHTRTHQKERGGEES